MDTFLLDLKCSLRTLGRTPGFAVIAVLTLALGIGANTALFSVVNGVLLNPLPFPQPDRLLAVYTNSSQFGTSSTTYPNFLDWRKETRALAAIAGYRFQDYNLTGTGEPERLHGLMVSAEFFSILGITPRVGRAYRPEEDVVGAAPVALISEGIWKRKFGSSKDAVGTSLVLNGEPHTILGVVPGKVALFRAADVFVPIGQWSEPAFRDRRIGMGTHAIGKLKTGVSLAEARSDMELVGKHLADAYPASNGGLGIVLFPLKEDRVGDVRPMLFVLLGAVGFVLLIACANVANLLLARSTGRTREFAIRAALGAGQARVVRQLLTESVLLALAGGAIGLAFAHWGLEAVLAALPKALPRTDEIALDWHVLAFTLGVALVTGILFGLAPALRMFKPNLQDTLKEGGRGGSGERHRTQKIFVAVEMALAVVLLVGAGLMIRSLAVLWGINPGFDPHNVITYALSLTSEKTATAAQLRQLYRAHLAAFEGTPGIEKVSMTGGSIPMTGDSEIPFWVEGTPKPTSENDMPFALFYLTTPGYRDVMRIPLIRGRFFTDQDDEHSADVAVIDEAFARKFFRDQDPVGKRVNLALLDTHPQIIGVVGHVEHWGLGDTQHETLQAQIYLPIWQVPDHFWTLLNSGCEYVARTAAQPIGTMNGLRAAASKVDSTSVLYQPERMDEIVKNSVAVQRFTMILLSMFAGLALVLSGIGIYGVIAYVVGQRSHEFGIRIALGAQRGDVLRMVLRDGAKVALAGVIVGLIAAVGLTRLMANMIYGVGVRDPVTFAGVAIVLTMVALAACYVPAWRATRVDPMIALRYE